jgi:hypothetical protein
MLRCKEFRYCHKLDSIYDRDMLDEQVVRAVDQVCGTCLKTLVKAVYKPAIDKKPGQET